MMHPVMLRRARIRGLKEGQVQSGRVEAHGNVVVDGAQRFQDYGFAANPIDGQGLEITVGGHTLILRMDRLAERPELAAYEVALWHKDGHMVKLGTGKTVEVVGASTVTVGATAKIQLNTPLVECSQALKAASLTVTGGASINGRNFMAHNHPVGNPNTGGVI